MNIGKLDRLIGLEEATSSRNPDGEQLQGWASVGKAWASVQYDAGNETVDNSQKQAVQRVTFLIRYRAAGLTTRYRVTYAGTVYDIEAVAEVGRRSGLRLTAYSRI